MPTFIVTYDTHHGRDYQSLYDGMAEHGGVRLAESVWGIELTNTPGEVRDWVRSLLDDDDTIVVLRVAPTPNWAARHAEAPAVQWLRAHIRA